MKCQKCGKHDATTHITEIINGVKNETYLCKYCGEQYHQNAGLHSIFKNNTVNFFDDFWNTPITLGQLSQSTAKKCPDCHSTLTDLKKSGRLGCSTCYSTFRDYLLHSLKGIHGSSTYIGKHPQKGHPDTKPFDKLEQLKKELTLAVDAQNFERAAELRDKIREMEA